MPVQEGLDGEQAIGCALVVEGEGQLRPRVAPREDVEGLEHLDGEFEGRPELFDDCCDEDREPGDISRDDVDACVGDDWDEHEADG